MVLEFEGADAAGAALGGLLLGEPGFLVVELVAQAIELGIDAVVNQAPFREAQRRGVEQLVAQFSGEGIQFGPGTRQG